MLKLQEGQCGLCAHFAEDHSQEPRIVQIRVNGEAPEDIVDECGHPKHAALHLRVTPHSGCDGFIPAQAA